MAGFIHLHLIKHGVLNYKQYNSNPCIIQYKIIKSKVKRYLKAGKNLYVNGKIMEIQDFFFLIRDIVESTVHCSTVYCVLMTSK